MGVNVQEENTTKVIFARRLVTLMAKNKVTQDQLASQIGVTQTTVWKWRKGAIPDGISTVKLARFFGVSVDTLFYENLSEDTTKGIISSDSNWHTHANLPPSHPPIKKIKIQELARTVAEFRAAIEGIQSVCTGLQAGIKGLEKAIEGLKEE